MIMTRICSIGLAAALMSSAAPGWSAPKNPVALAVSVKGGVKLTRAGVKKPRKLRKADELYLQDTVKTGPGAGASLVLLYGAEIRVNENSVLEFIPGEKRGSLVRMVMGQIWSRLLHKRGRLGVRTPSAILAIRGTEADIEQREALTVKVYEGHVDVENGEGKVSLKAGEMTKVAGPVSAPAAPVKMKPEDFGKWQEDISSAGIMELLKKLEARPDKKLEFKVGKPGEDDKDVEIKLKKDEKAAVGKKRE